jgi:DNA-binding NtrC family response regulator
VARILVVDDEANICWALKAELTAEGYTVDVAANGPEALDHIRKARPDLVLCDIRLPGMSGIDLLDRLREAAPAVPVILMTAYGDLDAAVGAMHKGAYEYLHKPLDLDQVKKTIVQALAGREAQILSSDAAMNGASEERGQAIRIVGRSVAMQQVFKLIGVVSQNDVTVLIEGEAGVGKELIARAIHQYSQRKAAPFVAVNCGGFSEGELERELFGGTGSAPAGREEWKGGGFESAHGGTLFLDEISELSISQQSKLLRILQEGHIERSRGAPTPVDTRVIAASNEPLREAVTAKRFREDLYFHLQVVKIAVPPLRHRKEDLYDLAAYFISLAARKTHRDLRGIQREAMEALVRHDWPGNVRELENVIRRAAVLARGAVIGLADLPPEIVEARRDGEPPEISGLRAAAEAELRARLQNADRGETSIYHDLVGTVEEGLVRAALAITGGNQVKAAELLGVNRTTLRKRLQPGSDDEPEQE